ncbi:StAR-related lipid transfer protein 7, mitochondrial [Platysternon megacephalum]|uniref:StAR-related lipid transfer protein 7, mitochondrial n=1 Tax=Platysternon megacephalum TaxID=55544 RepID=A0A4D9DNM6_9SAUR|nr:StAR-related lipid transfer protein 7, mitochondrial [Platysternon megacephalum]
MFHPLQRRPPASIYSYCARSAHWEARPGPAQALRSRYQWLLGWFQKEPGKCPGPKSLLSLLASQCSYVTGQRVRRAQQIGQLYGDIYSERARWSLFSGLWRRFQARHASACKLMAALTGVFLWEEERIQEEELRRESSDLRHNSFLRIALCLLKSGAKVRSDLYDDRNTNCSQAFPLPPK